MEQDQRPGRLPKTASSAKTTQEFWELAPTVQGTDFSTVERLRRLKGPAGRGGQQLLLCECVG